MRISIIGAGDISKISRHSSLSEVQVKKLIKDIGIFLAKKQVELVILPSRGIPYEVAKIYKQHNGKKVIGLIPRSDTRYGIGHIKEYLSIADEQIDIGNWYTLNGEIVAYGDVCICVGYSPGVATEIGMLKYHYKYLKSKTKLVIFKNTISQKLPKEVEEDLPKIYYISTIKELQEIFDSK
jgi:hypothetical protein